MSLPTATSLPKFVPSRRARLAGGQPISELMSRALENPHLISLAAGFVDSQTLPVEFTRDAVNQLLSDDVAARQALQYGMSFGLPALREALIERFAGEAADRLDVEQVLVTAGSNQLLHLVLECLLDPGDIVLCSSPTYLVFLGAVANLGGRSLGVATDDLGLVPEALDETLQRLRAAGDLPRVKAVYLVPYFDNPSGITMPLERAAEIVEIARRWSHEHRIHVIVDEAYRELRYSGPEVPTALAVDPAGETVIGAGTFSKSFSPGVRVGWGFLPRHLVGPLGDLKGNIDFGSPHFSQCLMAGVLRSGLFERHIERIREGYARKLAAMLEACERYLGPLDGVAWRRPSGGLYVWATMPPPVDTGPRGRLFDESIRQGVLYVPGEYCYPAGGESRAHNAMRLSFGVQAPEKIDAGIHALSIALERTLGES